MFCAGYSLAIFAGNTRLVSTIYRNTAMPQYCTVEVAVSKDLVFTQTAFVSTSYRHIV